MFFSCYNFPLVFNPFCPIPILPKPWVFWLCVDMSYSWGLSFFQTAPKSMHSEWIGWKLVALHPLTSKIERHKRTFFIEHFTVIQTCHHMWLHNLTVDFDLLRPANLTYSMNQSSFQSCFNLSSPWNSQHYKRIHSVNYLYYSRQPNRLYFCKIIICDTHILLCWDIEENI